MHGLSCPFLVRNSATENYHEAPTAPQRRNHHHHTQRPRGRTRMEQRNNHPMETRRRKTLCPKSMKDGEADVHEGNPMNDEENEYWECVACGTGGYDPFHWAHLRAYPNHALRQF